MEYLCARYCVWVEWIDGILSDHWAIDGGCLQCCGKMDCGPVLAGKSAKDWERGSTELDSVLVAYDGTITII